MFKVVCGLLVGWTIVNLALHVVFEHLSSSFAVDCFKLREGLNGNPEGDAPSHDGCRVIRKRGNGSSACLINQQKHRMTILSLGPVIGGYQLVNQRSPHEPHQWRQRTP